MKIVNIEKPKKKMNIYLVGDTHYPRGKRHIFKKVLDDILRDKNGYMIGLGDWVECINQNDPRYNPEEIATIIKKYGDPLNMINRQWDLFEDDIKPLAKKGRILGLHSGNHNMQFVRRHSFNALEGICKRLSIRYLGDGMTAWILKYKHKWIRMLTFHGTGAGTTQGYAYNQLDRYSRIFDDIDIIAVGHTHKLGVNISADRLRIISSEKELLQSPQYHCTCGSFLGNYDTEVASYSERKAYPPLPIGYVLVEIEDGNIKRVSPIVC